MLLIGSFLAGALLSLLLPVFLLIALVFWYVLFINRVPETAEARRAAATPAQPGRPTDVPVGDQGPGVAVSDETNRLPGE